MLALGQAANNYRTIQVKFTRMVYDEENDLVLINLLEYCRCVLVTQCGERWKADRQIAKSNLQRRILSTTPVCSVWWIPINLIFGGPIVSLHVILQLKDSPTGKQICYQEV